VQSHGCNGGCLRRCDQGEELQGRGRALGGRIRDIAVSHGRHGRLRRGGRVVSGYPRRGVRRGHLSSRQDPPVLGTAHASQQVLYNSVIPERQGSVSWRTEPVTKMLDMESRWCASYLKREPAMGINKHKLRGAGSGRMLRCEPDGKVLL